MNRHSTIHVLALATCALVSASTAQAGEAPAISPVKSTSSEPVFHAVQGGLTTMSLPFSESVRAGDMLYLSGQLGTDASGKLVGGGIRAETKQIMDNIGAALAHGGSSFANVVQCTVALADIKDWPAFNEVYRGYFTAHFPARMAFATTGLALGARAEVQCNAAVPR